MPLQLHSKRRSILPGFGLALGYTIFYLCLIVLIPLDSNFSQTASLSLGTVLGHRLLLHGRWLLTSSSFGASLVGAFIKFGFLVSLVAWVLVRYKFPGKRLFDSMVDLPFALPTAVAGIALTTIYAPNGWLGKPLASLGIKSAYSPLGVTIALTFIGLPFVVRSVQPVLEDMDKEWEEEPPRVWVLLAGRHSLAWYYRQFFPRRWRDSPWRLPGQWESTARSCSSPGTCR